MGRGSQTPQGERNTQYAIRLINLGLIPYDQALDLQHRLVAARKAGRTDDVLLLLEHPPVITLGRRGDESHVVAAPDLLARLGVSVRRVERGGDVTYHGPGQLVGYPILNLRQHRQDVGWYVRGLEETLIRALADCGVQGYRVPGLVGVWVDHQGSPHKVAAIGARIEEWVTYHGFALNVDPDMSHFELIVPCGIEDKAVVSMRQLLDGPVDFEYVCDRVAAHFAAVFDVILQPTTLEDLEIGD